MKVFYYLKGWKPYASATITGANSFTYVSQDGKKKNAKGVKTSFVGLKPNVSEMLPNAVYFNRVGSVGPKIFAFSDHSSQPINPNPIPKPQPKPLPPITPVAEKTEINWLIVAGIAVGVYLVVKA